MRGNPIIQSVLILIMLGLIGLAGVGFIRGGTYGMSDASASSAEQPVDVSNRGQIEVEVECHFSDPPQSYSLYRPVSAEAGNKGLGEIFKVEGSGEVTDYHDITLKGKADSALWLDVTWANEKPSGQYFVQLVLNVADQEPRKFTFLTPANTLNATIQLDLSTLVNDEH